MSKRTGNNFLNYVPIGWRLGPESFTTEDGIAYTCATARFPGYVVAPDGRLETGLVPAMCINGRFVLAYAGAGVINEAYSDIFAESIGFFHEDQDVNADYELGGDTKFGAVRSMSAPRSVSNGFFPDHYRDRYEFALTLSDTFWAYSGFVFVEGQYFGNTGDRFNYGGSHWNSGILSHAYYLAVEGGTHGSSGVTVDGVGGSDRAEMERIFFRAMRDLMPPMATLPLGAAAIRQSAADLAPGGAAERAIDQALRAVGLPPGLSDQRRPSWE